MLVRIRWQGRKMALPISQRSAIDSDESSDEAIGGWELLGRSGLLPLIFTRLHRKLTIFNEPSQFLLTSDPR